MAEAQIPYGRRLIPVVLAEMARDHPERQLYTISRDPKTYAKGSRSVTTRDFERMIDRLAWMLEEKLGKSTTTETVAYMGPNDIRYFAFIVAAPKAGYKVLFSSPRNSVSNHLHLLDKTSCSTFFKAADTKIDSIVDASPSPPHVIDIPELEDLLLDEAVPEYPYDRTFEDAKHDPALILHSSGTTGQVKPIVYTQRSFAAFDCHHLLKDENGNSTVPVTLPEGRMLQGMPYFHAGAIFMSFLSNVWFDIPTVTWPARLPVSVPGLMDVLRHVKPEMAMLAPSMIEEVTQSDEALKLAGTLKLIAYGGGAINERAGDIIVQHVNLRNYIGTSEAGAYPCFPHYDYKNDHMYLKFRIGEPGIEFRHRADDLYELVFVRHDGPHYETTWDTFPDLTEYPTSDLYRQHPTKPGLWRHAGRADDVIVLSNGEKVAPSQTETMLGQAPGVRGALLYGQKRFEVAALVELEPSAQALSREDLMEHLMPYIQKANKDAPGHAQLSKDRIIFTKPEKPLVRLPKGSVARKPSFNLYEMEIDEVYNRNSGFELSKRPLISGVSEEETVAVLKDIISKISGLDELPVDQDFLQVGIDSLKAITIVRLLKAQMESEDVQAPVDFINTTLMYTNPTVKDLAHALRNLGNEAGVDEQVKKLHEEMKQMLEKYTQDLPQNIAANATTTDVAQAEAMSVILTGSTGSLGSYLLDSLLANKRVVRIFSLNRSADGRKKQEQSSSSRGLSTNWGDRVHFLHADLSKPLLGLERKLYDRMVETATHIIHNQWPVNFNIPLSTFEPHVRGLRHLIDLAAAAPRKPSLMFTSSVGTVTNWAAFNPGVRVPEAETTDYRVPGSNGYAASKYVSEELLVAATQRSGVRALVVRVGQLAGSVDKGSVWNQDEWFPSVVASSQHLGVLPETLGSFSNIEFVPVDRGADILVDLCTSGRASAGAPQAHFFNMINPHPAGYADLVPTIAASLSPQPRVVPFTEWLEKLKLSSTDPHVDLDRNPAVKLIPFYEGLAMGDAASIAKTCDTARTEEWSEHMRELEGVKPDWMKVWVHGLGL